jgi:hypothetical protein
MQLRIVQETDYLRAELRGRETPEEMREALWEILAQCRRSGKSSVLIRTLASRPLFKVEEFGLSGFLEEMSNTCKVALVADNEELRASDEYIANMAQAKRRNVRAFRSETVALHWLCRSEDSNTGPSHWSRRYKFRRIVIAGAPDEPGVYALWQGEELIYYGRAFDGATIRSRLMEHYHGKLEVTHYSWEMSREPIAREGQLLREYLETFGRLPRLNSATA